MLNGKSVLITGGTGSFGKKFVETILKRYPEVKRIVIYSRDELKQFELKQKYPESKYPQLRFFIGDVRDGERLKRACEGVDVIRRVIFPVAGSGIFASYILALGRALGETMAVTMLIGNTNILPTSFTSTGNTMASVIANQFGEADGLKLSSLIAIGLLLFLITAIINFIGKMIMKKLS